MIDAWARRMKEKTHQRRVIGQFQQLRTSSVLIVLRPRRSDEFNRFDGAIEVEVKQRQLNSLRS